ncbi:alpha-2-HS-glycoprotein [Eublepharis macularius]|uniref:Alpha-2-HS-glycoprotein n=1 Tax=Eublepharis macularius TaxID=481883 RepID=A0AA97L1G2_EUBMA|nr:alpha-2-HS-glycoprotein [Eublepharis macularius]
MKSLVALVLLAQLLSCKAGLVPDIPPEVLPHKHLACDDPETEAAAAVAVNYINNRLKHGYKLVLNRIEKVVEHERRPHGKILELELDLLETVCHIVSPMPAENCTVRERTQHAVEADCDVKLLKDNGPYKVLLSKCHSSPDSHEDLVKFCPNCSPLSLLNDSNVVNTVNAALAKYNAINTTQGHYELLEIARGQHSHLANSWYVEFAIINTNCSAQHAKEHKEDCHVETGENQHFGFCKATFTKSLVEGTEDHQDVDCIVYDHQAGVAHVHLIEEHLKGNLGQAGRGYTFHNIIHSHNSTSHSHSHSDEVVPVEKVSALVKRAVFVALPDCPGRYRHYDI